MTVTLACDDSLGCDNTDMVIIDNANIQLRAESDPAGTGRTYTATVRAIDDQGNAAEQRLQINVPVGNLLPDDDSGIGASSGSSGSALSLYSLLLLWLIVWFRQHRRLI